MAGQEQRPDCEAEGRGDHGQPESDAGMDQHPTEPEGASCRDERVRSDEPRHEAHEERNAGGSATGVGGGREDEDLCGSLGADTVQQANTEGGAAAGAGEGITRNGRDVAMRVTVAHDGLERAMRWLVRG